MRRYFLINKGKKVFFNVPSTWDLGTHFIPERASADKTNEDILQNALSHPISTPALEDMTKPSSRVALLVDDATRPTPVHLILPPLLKEIHRLGVPQDRVNIIFAIGTHAPLSSEEIKKRLGKKVATNYPIIQHDSKSEDEAGNNPKAWIKEWLKTKKPILPEASLDFNMAIFWVVSISKRLNHSCLP